MALTKSEALQIVSRVRLACHLPREVGQRGRVSLRTRPPSSEPYSSHGTRRMGPGTGCTHSLRVRERARRRRKLRAAKPAVSVTRRPMGQASRPAPQYPRHRQIAPEISFRAFAREDARALSFSCRRDHGGSQRGAKHRGRSICPPTIDGGPTLNPSGRVEEWSRVLRESCLQTMPLVLLGSEGLCLPTTSSFTLACDETAEGIGPARFCPVRTNDFRCFGLPLFPPRMRPLRTT